MSERDGYRARVPCWVAAILPDPGVAFYATLFRWEAKETIGADSSGKHFIFTLSGRDVAAVGSERGGGALSVPARRTHYIWAESADYTVTRVRIAGVSVVVEPLDFLHAREAVVSDQAVAEFGVWQPGKHKSATLANEPGAWSISQLNTHDPDRSPVVLADLGINYPLDEVQFSE